MKPMIYAMSGGNGSGKTTYALKISKEKEAHFFSLDKTIKDFNQPIQSYEDYMKYYQQALDLMYLKAIQFLKEQSSVVFDFGGGISSRPWIKQIAESSGAEIEIFHLEVPVEERKRRVQKRNKEKHQDTYFFHMSDEEFDKHNQHDPPPPPIEEGIKIIRVNNK
ncbi:MAG: AAA family ATPase [Pseudobdellovibrionaceae bacterium]